MSALIIAIPGILDAPRDALRALSVDTIALRRPAMHATSVTPQSSGFWDWLGETLGIARARDLPCASIWARSEGIDVGTAFWFNASPVTMEVGRDDVRLVDAEPVLDADESDALLATLNAHFADDGLSFVAPRPSRWFARVTPAPDLTTTPPQVALGRGLRALLASGSDAARWRRWQNEMQMLLFEHPVNIKREAHGVAAVNSVWCWGGGTLPSGASANDLALVTADPYVAALGEFAGAKVLPASGLATAIASDRSRLLVVVAFNARENRVDNASIASAARAFAERKFETLSVIFIGSDRHVRIDCQRPTLWQRLTDNATPPGLDELFARWDARAAAS